MRPQSLVIAAMCPALLALATGCTSAPIVKPAAQVKVDPTTLGKTASLRATLKLNPAWGQCRASFVISAEEPPSAASKLALACAEATKLRKIGEAFTGTQAAASAPQSFKWRAQAGHCYRAYGAAAASIKTLDLFIKDSAGIVVAESASEDRMPVVLDEGAVCWKQDDDATVVVSVGDGSGAYAVELWGD